MTQNITNTTNITNLTLAEVLEVTTTTTTTTYSVDCTVGDHKEHYPSEFEKQCENVTYCAAPYYNASNCTFLNVTVNTNHTCFTPMRDANGSLIVLSSKTVVVN